MLRARSIVVLSLALVALGAFAPGAATQIRFYKVGGVGSPPEFCGVGDLDADGHDDFAYSNGPVLAISGADGLSVLLVLAAPAEGIDFGRSLAGPGDLDGDGTPDIVIGAPLADFAGTDAGLVRVVSGADGSELFTVHGLAAGERLGHDVAGAGDVDGDGAPDFLASAGDFSPSVTIDNGRVRLYSGADGSILHEWLGPTDTERFGITVSAAGEVDADGRTDLMIGALDSSALRVYSGLDFSLLHTLPSTPHDIAPAGDLDGDGHGDVATLMGWPTDGWLRVYSGATGGVIREFGIDSAFELGASIAAPGDLDADGVPDYVLGQTGLFSSVPGRVQLFSGDSGTVVYFAMELPGAAGSSFTFGGRVRVVGDLDGNGLLDYGSTTSNPSNSITFLAGNKGPLAAFAQGPVQGATAATLGGSGTLLPGSPLTLQATQLPPASAAFLVAGVSQLDAPFKGGTLVPAVDALLGPFVTDDAGGLTLGGNWPPSLPGFFSVWFQVWAADDASPSGFRATNGLVATQL